jgi:hypothetical protein
LRLKIKTYLNTFPWCPIHVSLNFITELRTYKITCASRATLKNSWKWCNLFFDKFLTMFTNIHTNTKQKKIPLNMLNTYN